MQNKKQFLEDKFIKFQLEIDALRRTNNALIEDYEEKLNSMNLEFIKLLDFIENINADQTTSDGDSALCAQRLAQNIATLSKKIGRTLKRNKITAITFPDNRATMEYSKIIDTITDNQREEGLIVETLKTGYINHEQHKIVRKAELVTIAN